MKSRIRSKIFLSFLVAFNFFICSYIPINATENGTNVVFEHEWEECPENSICTYRYNHQYKVYMLAEINEMDDEYSKDILADVPGTDVGGGSGDTWEIEVYLNGAIKGSGSYPSNNTINVSQFSEVLLMKDTSLSKGNSVEYDISTKISFVNDQGYAGAIFAYGATVTINGVLLEEFTVDSSGIANFKGISEINNDDGIFMIYVKFGARFGNCRVDILNENSFKEDDRDPTGIRLDNISGMISSLIGAIGNLLDAILNLPSLIFEQFTGILSSIWSAITNLGDVIISALESLGNFIVNAINQIQTWLTNLGNFIVSAINKIQQWLTDLLNGIIQGLKDLFIPSSDYFKNYFDSLYDFFSKKLGILLLPFDILISLMNNVLNLGNGDGYIHVPKFEYMGITLIPKIDYNLKQDVQQVLGNYYDLYYLLTDVIIYFLLFNMAKKKFENIVGGSSE